MHAKQKPPTNRHRHIYNTHTNSHQGEKKPNETPTRNLPLSSTRRWKSRWSASNAAQQQSILHTCAYLCVCMCVVQQLAQSLVAALLCVVISFAVIAIMLIKLKLLCDYNDNVSCKHAHTHGRAHRHMHMNLSFSVLLRSVLHRAWVSTLAVMETCVLLYLAACLWLLRSQKKIALLLCAHTFAQVALHKFFCVCSSAYYQMWKW